MIWMEKGVYIVIVNGDFYGYEYVFCICNNLEWIEMVDLYVKVVIVNGEKGVVLCLD